MPGNGYEMYSYIIKLVEIMPKKFSLRQLLFNFNEFNTKRLKKLLKLKITYLKNFLILLRYVIYGQSTPILHHIVANV